MQHKQIISLLVEQNPDAENYYQILGVRRNASSTQIREAFRTLTLKYHPDKNKNLNTAALYVKIKQAYETLYDPARRAHYDRSLCTSSEEANAIENSQVFFLECGDPLLSFILLMTISLTFSSFYSTQADIRTSELDRLISLATIAELPTVNYSYDFSTTEPGVTLSRISQALDRNSLDITSERDLLSDLGVSLERYALLNLAMSLISHTHLDPEHFLLPRSHPAENTIPMTFTRPEFSSLDIAIRNSWFENSISRTIPLPNISTNQAKLDEIAYDGKIPDEFICPLSCSIMTDPVSNPTEGLPDVERSWIELEINRTKKNPFNNQPLASEDLAPNTTLSKKISDFVTRILEEKEISPSFSM